MPLFGAHQSVAGGHHNAILTGQRLGCDVVQIFTKNNLQWNAPPISPEAVQRFREAQATTGVKAPVAHACYLLNMASPERETYARTVAALVDEVDRAEALGLDFLVVHPGAHKGQGEEKGLRQIANCLDTVHARRRKAGVRILLETTAGQGTSLGGRFEHLAEVLDRVRAPERLGVCLDTCHVFAAGYDLRTARAAKRTLADFDRAIGLDRLLLCHFNDSKGELGGRLDRHEHIGHGRIGTDAFSYLVKDSVISADGMPIILETPKGKKGRKDHDQVNLGRLRSLAAR